MVQTVAFPLTVRRDNVCVARAKAVVVAAARRQQGSANRLRPTQRAFKPAPVPLEPMKIKIVNNAAPANQPQKVHDDPAQHA